MTALISPAPGISLGLGSYRDVLDGQYDLIFTSPPYNLPGNRPRIDGMRGTDSYDPRSFGPIAYGGVPDGIDEGDYQDQQAAFLLWAADHLAPGGTLAYNHKPRQRGKQLIDPHQWMYRPEVRKRIIEATYPVVWDRGSTHNTGRGQLWPTTERVYIMRKANDVRWKMDNYRGRGLEAKFQRDLWRIPVENWKNGSPHPAPFPLVLAEEVIRMWSRPGETVCDPYSGSGTTAVAALLLGRRFEGAETEQEYHELAVARVQRVLEEAAS